MAKYGYWITKYISISTIIGISKKSYENAYQYSEADGGDIGYFIQYNLEVISKAVERLTLYLHRKAGEAYNERQNIRKSLNLRQLMAYDYLKSGAVVSVTAKEIASKCGVSIPTATKDLNHMVSLGLIEKVKTFGMGYVYILHDEYKNSRLLSQQTGVIYSYVKKDFLLEVYVVVRAAKVVGSAHLQAVAGADGVGGAEMATAGVLVLTGVSEYNISLSLLLHIVIVFFFVKTIISFA